MFPRIALGSVASLLVLAAATFAPAAVNVNIGIAVPAPPRLVAVPGTPVAYAPAVPDNYFVYAGRYYVFANGVWYASRGYNGRTMAGPATRTRAAPAVGGARSVLSRETRDMGSLAA